MRSSPFILFLSLSACVTLAGCSQGTSVGRTAALPQAAGLVVRTSPPVKTGVNAASTIQHVVVLVLENRSFDSYFGTFPGVNGIPMKNGVPQVNCNPDPQSGLCILPYHSTNPVNYGGPHAVNAMWVDIDSGKLDGFIESAETQPKFQDPSPDDVMGYHDCTDLPEYCKIAATYTIADNHFAATNSWSAMAHLYLVSGWSAVCTNPNDPMSCTTSNNANPSLNNSPWTDITWLLHSHGIPWKYYVDQAGPIGLGPRYDGGDDEQPKTQGPFQPSDWNPLPGFNDVQTDGQLNNIVDGKQFEADCAAGTLPAVSWVIPTFSESDHPASPISGGQTFVKKKIGAVMRSPEADSTLILVTWDEWGGFYDHVVPPVIDGGGYGFRTPLVLVGKMVKRHYVDHQLLTSDAYLKLIEDLFLGNARIDPSTDGRPDSRPDVRENVPGLGDLRNDLRP